MKKTMSILVVAGLVLALASAAQAALIIYVDENIDGNVYFSWNGIIGNSGTGTTQSNGGSADQIVPVDGQIQVANDHVNFTVSQHYAGASYAYGTGAAFSDFIVTCNIPFQVRPTTEDVIRVGKIGGDAGTAYPDLATDTFTGSFSLPGTFATYGLFDTPATSLTLNDTVALWTATNGDGAISFAAIPEPATMSVLAIGGLALLRRRKRA